MKTARARKRAWLKSGEISFYNHYVALADWQNISDDQRRSTFACVFFRAERLHFLQLSMSLLLCCSMIPAGHPVSKGDVSMKFTYAVAAVLSFTLSTAAIAGDVAVIKERALVKTTDGRKVGFIDRVMKNAAGEPTAVQIIYSGRFVVIPVETLSSAEKGLVTTLTAKEVNRL
ncbi:hypothetical protein J3E64_001964 [Sphingobium sp. OAS761]|uniref:hypothetical protein n=1 Tax=Sphingobium sp. OAS761 TaxID=2817901 RepID=UPI0020A0AFDF|nr:hypothetical protein [Sphingobium sp. OAS761]MCP1470276.1 hypothetical protein [Sphingobium sp. OAS761]